MFPKSWSRQLLRKHVCLLILSAIANKLDSQVAILVALPNKVELDIIVLDSSALSCCMFGFQDNGWLIINS
jgi:hypothetical protein